MPPSPEQWRLVSRIVEMILQDFAEVNEQNLGEIFTEVLKELRVRGGTGLKVRPDDAARPPTSPRARQISRRRDEGRADEGTLKASGERAVEGDTLDLSRSEDDQGSRDDDFDFSRQIFEGEMLSLPSGPFHERDQVIHQRVDDGEHVLGLEMFSDRALRTIHAQLTDTGGIFLPLNHPIALNSIVDVCVMLPVIQRETWFQGRIVACAAAGTAIDIQPFDELYKGHWEQAIILMCEGRGDHLRPTEGGPVTVSPRRDKTASSVSFVAPRPPTRETPGPERQERSSTGAAALLDDSATDTHLAEAQRPRTTPRLQDAAHSRPSSSASDATPSPLQGATPETLEGDINEAPSSREALSHDAPSLDSPSLDSPSLDAPSLDATSLDAHAGSTPAPPLAREGHPNKPAYAAPPHAQAPGAPHHRAGVAPQPTHVPTNIMGAMPPQGFMPGWSAAPPYGPPHQAMGQFNPMLPPSIAPLTLPQLEDIAQRVPTVISHEFPSTSLNSTLLEISTQNSDGLLSLRTPQMVYHVVVQVGSPVDVLTSPDNPDLHLGALLVQAKRIEWEQHKAAERLCSEQNIPYPDALTELRLMPYHQVLAAMESRMRYAFKRFFELPAGLVEWRTLERLPYRYTTPPLRLPAMALKAELQSSAALPKAALEAFHDSHTEDLPKRVEPPPCSMAELGLNPKQNRFLKNVLGVAQSMHALMAMSNLNRSDTLALLHALDLLGFITFEARNIQQDYHKRLIDQVQQHAADLRRLNHFETLEVHWSAYTEMVHKAYQERRLQYSLDAFPEEIHSTIKPACQKIMNAVEAAYKHLKDPAKRRAYRMERVSDVQIQNVINVDLKRGDIQLMRMETREAYECYSRVLELEPRHPQARAKLAAMKRKLGKKPPPI